MAQAECAKGHLYDSSRYASCPYCSGQNTFIDFPLMNSTVGKTVPLHSQTGAGQDFASEQNSPSDFSPLNSPVGKTLPLNSQSGAARDFGSGQNTPAASSLLNSSVGKTRPLGYGSGRGFGYDGGDTVQPPDSPGGGKAETVISKTHAVYTTEDDVEPVVGWLVCISGEEKGKDFRLMPRLNRIGSGPENDVCIKGDDTISRLDQLRIGYDAKHNTFTAVCGSGKNLNYLNDQPIYSEKPLSSYDLLEIGKTQFYFVPLCTDRFVWDDEWKKY